MTTPTTKAAELPDPSPDQLRAIAQTARNSSGSASDDCGPLAYVLHGWRAAAIAFRAQQAAQVEALSAAQAGVPALSPTEQKWVLQSPVAIAQLLTFIDIDFSQGESAGMDMGNWPPKRYTELKEIGRKIIEQDPDCFDENTLREFGFAAPQPSPSPAPARVTPEMVDALEQAADALPGIQQRLDTVGARLREIGVLPAPAQPGQEGERDYPPLPEPRPIPGFYDLKERSALRYTEQDLIAYVDADRAARAAPQPATADAVDEAFEAVRKAFCKLQRYSFFLDKNGNVARVPQYTGNWVQFHEVHTLFDPVAVDAALAAQRATHQGDHK